MKHRFSKQMKVLSIVLLVVGMVSAALAYSLKKVNGLKVRHAKGFTLVTKETITLNDPAEQAQPQQADYVITTTYRRSDGAWKTVKAAYKADGALLRKDVGFGLPGRGVFQIDSAQGVLNFLSSMPPKETTSYVAIRDGHDEPRFSRDEVVRGYKTYVLHYDLAGDGTYEEEYYAPELDYYALKGVKVAPYGSSVTEMIQLTLGEPDESVFASLPNLLVNYDHFKKKIEAVEADGNREAAEGLRRDLEQQMAKEMK